MPRKCLNGFFEHDYRKARVIVQVESLSKKLGDWIKVDLFPPHTRLVFCLRCKSLKTRRGASVRVVVRKS